MSSRFVILLTISLALTISIIPAFSLTELQKATITDPRLENAFGAPIVDNVNIDQQIQISAGITNNQEKSQKFVYMVQIKNELDMVVSLGWFSGELTSAQKLSPSLSWIPKNHGVYKAEIFVWEDLKNRNALSEYSVLQINVS